ncbi:MAG: pyridoxal-phosphate dependent enzyme [Bacteroidia bacterium]|nr:pyridoxal-phosphate dependent enzyme [Bacteroidia bacterium]
MNNRKYFMHCSKCGLKIADFASWFRFGQKCPDCNSLLVNVWYYDEMKNFIRMIMDKSFKPASLWNYFDYLPLMNRENIVSSGGEGVVPLERWNFLERYSKEKYGLNIIVWAHRQDDNYSTGTFKDLAGTMVASILKENNISRYVVASTGNIGVAYSRYLAAAGISLSAFIPQISIKSQEAEIGCFGQTVYRVDGDYHRAKELAKEYATKYGILLSAGNFDPMRIEAKKTMVYEWLRLLPDFPTVYMQALSGGSGPIGIAKACEEFDNSNLKLFEMPRFILTQPGNCAPMAHAWDDAKAKNFPHGWEFDYPVYKNPVTRIQTLSTGNPTAFPVVGPLVHKSRGEILAFDEEKTVDVARLVAYEAAVRLGPASAVTVGGFFDSLKLGYLKEGDIVLLNIGEGIRRAPDFIEFLAYTTKYVNSIDDCQPVARESYRQHLWDKI